MATGKSKAAETRKGIVAIRDPAFSRIAADVSLAKVVKQDVDVALMVRQPSYRDIMMGVDGQPDEVSGGMTLIEVGRLRMPAESAMQLAFGILQTCAEADFFAIDNFDEGIAQVREMIIAAAAGDTSGS